jgi:hypothetical protein
MNNVMISILIMIKITITMITLHLLSLQATKARGSLERRWGKAGLPLTRMRRNTTKAAVEAAFQALAEEDGAGYNPLMPIAPPWDAAGVGGDEGADEGAQFEGGGQEGEGGGWGYGSEAMEEDRGGGDGSSGGPVAVAPSARKKRSSRGSGRHSGGAQAHPQLQVLQVHMVDAGRVQAAAGADEAVADGHNAGPDGVADGQQI